MLLKFFKRTAFAGLVLFLMAGLLVVSCDQPTDSDKDAAQPVINTQPAAATDWDVSVAATLTAVSVTASSPDGGELSYQWYSSETNSATGGAIISGQTNAALTLEKEDYAENKDYYFYVIVTNTNNAATGIQTASKTSNVAKVAVIGNTGTPPEDAEAPVIDEEPEGGDWDIAADATFSIIVTASVTDGGDLSYQWYSNTTDSAADGEEISGQTDDELILAKTTYTVDGEYYFYVIVTNTNNDATGAKTADTTSAVAKVTVTGNAGIPLVNAGQPDISTQPAAASAWDVSVASNFTAVSVTASSPDGGELSYQWYSNSTNSASGGEEISGQTNAVLTLAKTTYTVDSDYYFYVVVTNTNNAATGTKTASKTSTVAKVTVTGNAGIPLVNAGQPDISTQPAAASAWDVSVASAFIAVSVTASSPDGGELSYQWYSNSTNSASGGEEISGQTNAVLTLAKTAYTVDGDYYFYVVVTNTNNAATGTKTASKTSTVAKVTVTGNAGPPPEDAEMPEIETQPYGGAWDVSAEATFSITVSASVTDGGTLSYQWYNHYNTDTSGGTLLSGEASATLILKKEFYTENVSQNFYVEVTNTNNNATTNKTATNTSASATVSVYGNAPASAEPPEIITQPAATSNWDVGATATFTAVSISAVSPDGGQLSYQWYSNSSSSNSGGSEISGQTDATLTLAKADYDTNGSYYFYVVVTNTLYDTSNTTTSNVAEVVIMGNVFVLESRWVGTWEATEYEEDYFYIELSGYAEYEAMPWYPPPQYNEVYMGWSGMIRDIVYFDIGKTEGLIFIECTYTGDALDMFGSGNFTAVYFKDTGSGGIYKMSNAINGMGFQLMYPTLDAAKTAITSTVTSGLSLISFRKTL
ncbi:MAG: hypothetical protein FWG46_02750 [Treponema sp.]|nr:hypothetical protein [Treponema sp.]